ncbi:TBC1 domain family member 20 [Dermatophagoides pteronyssinus]|uniref:TBC1 domain family member 20 n=1 Tax=Dermatophagoides pteronyssinus TaxID=6956 RepID=UPI003F66681C
MIDNKKDVIMVNGEPVMAKTNKNHDDDILFTEFKANQIKKYLQQNDRLALKTLACSNGGFVTNKLRVKVWCRLAYVDNDDDDDNDDISDDQNDIPDNIQRNDNYRQVILDVERSLKRFPPSVKEVQRIAYQDKLTEIIIRILDHNPDMYYYQGYHDVCLTFLLVMNEHQAFRLINAISRSHLRFYMERTMNTTSNLLEIIYLIIRDEDDELHDHLIRSEVGTIFSLSWVITWFSHVLNDLDDILRLFDLFISTHYLMPIYMTVAILMWKKSDILLVDCDMASMHKFLTAIPIENSSLPIDRLVRDTLELSVRYPPEDTLERQKQIETNALNDDDDHHHRNDHGQSIIKFSIQFLRRNIFSFTFIGFISIMIHQFCYDYLYS